MCTKRLGKLQYIIETALHGQAPVPFCNGLLRFHRPEVHDRIWHFVTRIQCIEQGVEVIRPAGFDPVGPLPKSRKRLTR